MMEGSRVIERLVTEGRLDKSQVDRLTSQVQRDKGNLVDAVIESGLMSEAEFLKSAAGLYRTQFVGTEKLAKAPIERSVLEMVPIRVVERFGALPILFDRVTQSLSVVLVDFEQLDVDKHLSMATNARQVKCYLARPATVRALIRRWYYGDNKPLAALLQAIANAPAPMTQAFAGSGYGLGDDDDFAPPPPKASPMPSPMRAAPAPISIGIDLPGFGAGPSAPSAPASSGFEDLPGFGELPRGGPNPPAAASDPPAVVPSAPKVPDFKLPAFDLGGGPPPAPRPPSSDSERDLVAVRRPSIVPPRQSLEELAEGARSPRGSDDRTLEAETLVETASVLVALLEQGREELRGHSAQVARLARKVLERIGLSDQASRPILLACQLHDVGKASTYHLTALNVAQYDGHRAQAQKSYLAPSRLFESAKLPSDTLETLQHLYERYDGQGFPDRLSGRDIPLGARVLAVVESYVDVTTNSRNPYRKPLPPREAIDALGKFRQQIFDPTVLDVVRLLVLGDDLERKLLADRKRVLVVDPDPEETTVLEMRLIEHGYDTVVIRDADSALRKLDELDFDLLVSEVELPGTDGFKFLSRIKSGEHGAMPILVLTRRSDRDSVDRGFALGVGDYLVKPASADVVAAKIRVTLEAAPTTAAPARGVSGSLLEMSLPDVVQILANGRRTGRLTVKSEGLLGEIHFRDGMIYDGSFGGAKGAEGIYAMLALVDGEFAFDSSFQPQENVVQASTEGLLLEGMRRLDEGRY